MAEIFPNLRTDLYTQVHESNRSSYYFNSKQSSPRHIIMKLSQIKDKERILKGTREKKEPYKGILTELSVNRSAETV